ncbi:hypothetical protein ACU8KH_03641 [Lachancea thermotolerans]
MALKDELVEFNPSNSQVYVPVSFPIENFIPHYKTKKVLNEVIRVFLSFAASSTSQSWNHEKWKLAKVSQENE